MITERAKKIIDLEGFMREWYILQGIGYTGQHSFDLLNEEHFNTFGKYKYSTYQSFLSAKSFKEKRDRDANKTT